MIDFRWTSRGGLMLDGDGDIAVTDPTTLESVQDMVRTRVKAALEDWKLYRIGADLQARIGDIVNDELHVRLQRQVAQSLTTDGLLSRSAFDVQTLSSGGTVMLMVYINGELITKATISKTNPKDFTVQ